MSSSERASEPKASDQTHTLCLQVHDLHHIAQAEVVPLSTAQEHLGGKGSVITPLNLVFSIQDTGNGIREEAQDRIFKPFMQEDNTTARRFGGTGIGLSISRKLAHLMGGDLTFVSRHTVGSTFTCNITLGQKLGQVGSLTGRMVGEEQLTVQWEKDIRNLTVVLVDYHILRCKVAESYLLQLEVKTLLAKDLRGAATLLQSEARRSMGGSSGESVPSVHNQADASVGGDREEEQQPSAVLLDWNASWVGEYATCPVLLWGALQEGIWQSKPKLPIVFLVERMDAHLKYIADKASAEGKTAAMLVKPLRRACVVASLAEALKVVDSGPGIVETKARDLSSLASIERLLSGRRFLVVDDNMVNRKVASKFLTKLGVEVDCVEGGQEALERLVQAPAIEAILMDIQMPGMDGAASTRFNPRICVIVQDRSAFRPGSKVSRSQKSQQRK